MTCAECGIELSKDTAHITASSILREPVVLFWCQLHCPNTACSVPESASMSGLSQLEMPFGLVPDVVTVEVTGDAI